MEEYSCYKYNISNKYIKHKHDINNGGKAWVYTIYANDDIESDEWFEFEAEARHAAIGHITTLENP